MCYLISIFIGLLVLTLPCSSIGKELERGGAHLGIDSQISRSETDFFTINNYETDFYMDLWQKTVNFGILELDILYALIEKDLDPDSWSARFAVRDFYLGYSTIMDIELGDTDIMFRTIPHFFSNYFLPTAYFRGINSEIRSGPWELKYFFGWATRRKGITGKAFERTDQILYGFNLGIELPRESFVGVGFMRGQNEKDLQGNLIIRNNNIAIADARLGIYSDLGIMGEYLHSFYDRVDYGKVNDYSLVVGPTLEKKKGSLEANYRKFGRNFRFINDATRTSTNQEGVFVRGNLSLREEHKVNLHGSANYYWNDPTPGSGINRLFTLSTNIGATVFPKDNFYLTSYFNITKRDASGTTFPVDDLRYDASLGSSVHFANRKINVYSSFRYAESRVNSPEKNILRQPDGIVGIRWNVRPRLNMEFEGEVKKSWDTLKTRDLLTSKVNYYLYWRPLSKTTLRPSVEYGRADDSIRDGTSNTLSLGINYGQQFHRGWRMSTSVRWSNNWGLSSGSYLNASINIEKAFYWGRPVLRQGTRKEDMPLYTGKISGYLFIDENDDGLRQPWEKGIPDVALRLGDRFVEVTDVKGEFEFENVMVGKQVVQVMMAGMEMKYNLMFHREEVDVKLRQTTELNFPVTLVN